MSAKVFTADDAKAAKLVLVDGHKGVQAVHDLVTAYRANRRSGTAHTKTRGEVRGSGKKIYRQKGTGNARHGDRGAPIFVGGGVAFGPRHRDYTKKVSKSTRRLALRRVLGGVIADGRLKTVSSFSIADGKTKSFVKAVSELTDTKKVLLVAKNFDESTRLAARNVSWVQLVDVLSVNIEELLYADTILLVEDALEVLAERTA